MKKRSLLGRIWRARWCYAALLPSLAFLAVFTLYPAISGLVRSLYNWKSRNYFSPTFNGGANYLKLLRDATFWESFRPLLAITIAGFIKTFFICMPVTYLVFKLSQARRWNRFFQYCFVIPMMVPDVVVNMYWRFFYNYNDGILTSIMKMLGMGDRILVWLGDYGFSLWAILLMGFPYIGGFSFLILLSGFLNIDRALDEAAEIDGAGPFTRFFRIDVPLILPQMKVLSVLGMINGLQSFAIPLIMTNGTYGTMVPGLYMYQTAFTVGNFGYAAAMGVVMFAIILVITLLQQKLIRTSD